MQRLANTCFTMGTLVLALMIAYVFNRYSGNYPEFISWADYYAELVWLYVSIIAYKYILHNQISNIATSSSATIDQ